MKTLKKLSFVLAFAFTLFAAGCSDIEFQPVGTDDDDEPIIISPKPPVSGTLAADTVSII